VELTQTRRSTRPLAALVALAVAALAILATGAPARAENTATVDIVDFGFVESSITIAPGTTVTWTNTGQAPHTVTADSGAWTSDTLENGDSFSWTFEKAGTFTYHCAIHPKMTGTIIVADNGSGMYLPNTGAGSAAPGSSSTRLLGLLGAAMVLIGFAATRLRRLA
jgi:plastocyanin